MRQPESDHEVAGARRAGTDLTAASDLRRHVVRMLALSWLALRGALARAVLGSVSDEILHNAPCDVLVVHPPSDGSS